PIPIPTKPSTSKPQKKHKPKRKHTKEPKVSPTESQAEHNVPLPSPSHDPLPSGKDSLKLKELIYLCTNLSNKVLDLESEVIDIKSTYKAKIEKLESRKVQAEAYNLDLDHQEKVLSMLDVNDEEHAGIEEVVEVVTAAKLITEPLKRQVQINLDEEVARQLKAELNADINWNAMIEQVKRSERLTNALEAVVAALGILSPNSLWTASSPSFFRGTTKLWQMIAVAILQLNCSQAVFLGLKQWRMPSSLDSSSFLEHSLRLDHSLLPTIFWAKVVNTAWVLVTKPHNKTPYELIIGRPPSISFMRPFGCLITILNTLDPLGKFDRKAEEGFLVEYSVTSKAFRSSDDKAGDITANDDAGKEKVQEPVSEYDQTLKNVLERMMNQEKKATKKLDDRIQVQMSIDEELARKLHEEKLARFNAEQEAIDIARKEKVVVEVDQAHDIDWSDPAVIRYHTLQNRPRSVAEIHSFVPMNSELEVQRSKRKVQEVDRQFIEEENGKKSDESSKPTRKKTLAWKRAGGNDSQESVKKQKLEDNTEKKELKAYLDIVSEDEFVMEVESLATKQDVMDLHRLVEERYTITSPEGYDLMLWGDLKTLFEPDGKQIRGKKKSFIVLCLSWLGKLEKIIYFGDRGGFEPHSFQNRLKVL
nr:ribonuclease H-like domain-containing protein [Tanacetum cinerariifolium]